MVRLAVIALIATVVLLFVWWFLKPSSQEEGVAGSTEMVQDPNCEVYVPKPEAVYKIISGQDHYCCSDKCADEYLNKQKTR